MRAMSAPYRDRAGALRDHAVALALAVQLAILRGGVGLIAPQTLVRFVAGLAVQTYVHLLRHRLCSGLGFVPCRHT